MRNCPSVAKSLPALATRSFHSTKPVANTITVNERRGPTGTIVDTPGVIDQYGAIPFFGLLATALISKEVLIFNEEVLLAMNTAAVAVTAYVGVGDKLDKIFDAERTADNNRYHDSFNAVVEQIELYKSIEAKKLEKVQVIKDLCAESKEVNAAYLKYLDIKVRHEARQAMLTKLAAIKTKEAQEEAQEYQELIDLAIDGVYEAYEDEANAALRNASLEFAIKNIGAVTESSEDPVRVELYKQLKKAEEAMYE